MRARRQLIAGNWKLHNTVAQSQQLAREVRAAVVHHGPACDILLIPTYTALWSVSQALQGSSIAVGGQDLYYEDQGAFTGAISAPLLQDAGCTQVLVGHSERRLLFGETLSSTRLRLDAALKNGMGPLLCVGETLSERLAGKTLDVVSAQLQAAMGHLSGDALAAVTLAYEPVWAIGTGQVATPEQAQQVHGNIRDILRRHGAATADSIRILYGGSVKPANAAAILAQPDVDGALVGGASLSAEQFVAIAQAAHS